LWAEAIASSDVAFARYLESAHRMPDPLRLAVARHRRDTKLADAIVATAPKVTEDQLQDWVAAALRQRSPAGARQLFARRAGLPAGVRSYLTLILEHALEANLGQVLHDWAEFLAGQ